MLGLILGILGPSKSGKDTLADRLVSKHGFVKISLADPMKRYLRDFYDFSHEQLWGPSEERNRPDLRYPTGLGYLTPRTALQTMGTEWARTNYENTLVAYFLRVAKRVLKGDSYSRVFGIRDFSFLDYLNGTYDRGRKIVVPDLRYQNEVSAVRNIGGLVVRLKRLGTGGDIDGGVKNHRSEKDQESIPDSECDFVIDVSEGLENYTKQIDAFASKLPKEVRLKLGV
jgi:hypothetical protein